MAFIIFVIVLLLAYIVYLCTKEDNETQPSDYTWHNTTTSNELAEWKGQFGEDTVKHVLSLLPKEEYIVLNDVLLPTNNGTTQLDHIVFARKGIFVIETKNYSGTIYGAKASEQWYQYIHGKKYEIYNPILQNDSHVRAVAKRLHIGRQNIYPLVVFTGSAVIKASVDQRVISINNLFDSITKQNNPVFSTDQTDYFARVIDNAMEENDETKRAHINSVHEKVSRRNREIQAGGCPLCNGTLILRKGKYGSFYGCSNYPNCRYTKNI